MVPPDCPTPNRLRQLAGGQIPDAELVTLTAHLDRCTTCRHTLDQLLALSGVWPVPPATAEPVVPGPALAEVLGRLPTSAESLEYDLLDKTQETPADPVPSLAFLEPMDKPGFLGRLDAYEVTQVLGFGGMGVVLKAFDPGLHRFVALKVLAAHLANHPAANRRFVREARAAAAISHEHVVAVHAVHTDGPLPYLTLEYVSGVSLQERLERTGPFAVEEVLRIGHQTALGLAAAHAQGLIHRDVKPANILLENSVERVKLTDFGLARAVDDAALTHSGVIVGTPLYMAPEQARNEALDQRADLFSLGSILYALCTGRPPFRAHSSLAVLKRICDDTPRPVREINSEIPEWLCAIITKLHAKHPDERYQSAREVAELLGRHLAHLQQPGRIPQPAPVAAHTGKRRWLVWGALVALLLAWPCYEAVQAFVEDARRDTTPHSEPPAVERAGQHQKATLLKEADQQTQRQGQPLGNPRRFQLDRVPPGEVVLLPGGRRLLARVPDDEKTLQLIDLEAKVVSLLKGHTGAITALAVSPDGRRAVTGSGDRTAILWDLEKREQRQRFEGHVATVTAVALFGEDGEADKGQVCSVSLDGTLRLWNAATGKLFRQIDRKAGRLEEVYAAAFRPTGAQVVTASAEGNYWRWDVATGKAVPTERPYHFSTADMTVKTLSRDGYYLAFATSRRGLLVHEVLKGFFAHSLPGHQEEITSLAISPDNRYLLSGSRDRTMRLWDLDKGRELRKFVDPFAEIERVAFSTDGRHFLAVNATGTVWLWEVAD